MNGLTGTVVYILIWWVVLFTVLPWRSRPPTKPGTGHATSAPETPNLGIKFLATSLIAALLWVVVYVLVQKGVVDFRGMAMSMMQNDQG